MAKKEDLDILALEKIINFKFKNKELLKEALTHRSYLNENIKWELPNNERLEFLGDAVLELGVTEKLFSEYPEYPEGKLTSIRAALVNYLMLARVAKEVNLGKFILLSKGELRENGRAKEVILANAMEALIGAIYLDQGKEPAFEFINNFVMPNLEEVMAKKLYKDPKSLLQEIIQEREKVTPSYEVVSEIGPDHSKTFKVAVFSGKKKMAEGAGPSKQEAEVEAARKVLQDMEEAM